MTASPWAGDVLKFSGACCVFCSRVRIVKSEALVRVCSQDEVVSIDLSAFKVLILTWWCLLVTSFVAL